MLRVSISGTHSSGKTTLLEALKVNKEVEQRGFKFIEGVTRRVKRMGVEINEGGEDATQLLCMSMDLLNFHEKRDSNDIVISDRCLLDTLIYTKYLFLHGSVTKKCLDVVTEVWEMYKSKYDLILIPNHFEVNLADDNERSTNRLFRDSIYTLFMEEVNNNIGIFPTYIIGGSVGKREETVLDIIQDHIDFLKQSNG